MGLLEGSGRHFLEREREDVDAAVAARALARSKVSLAWLIEFSMVGMSGPTQALPGRDVARG